MSARYRTEIRPLRWGRREVRLVTTHVIPTIDEHGQPSDPREVQTEQQDPPVVLGERWARWKGRRMVAAALRRDVREGQPWAVAR